VTPGGWDSERPDSLVPVSHYLQLLLPQPAILFFQPYFFSFSRFFQPAGLDEFNHTP